MSDFRPRSAAEIADAAIQLVRRHYSALLPLSALLSIPNVLLGLVTARATPLGTEVPTPGAALALAATVLVSTVWWAVSSGALVGVASDAYLGERVDPWESARRAFGRAGTLIGATLAAYLLAVLLFVLVAFAVALVGGIVGAIVTRGAPGESTAVIGIIALVVGVAAMVLPMLLFARYVVITPIVMVEGGGVGDVLRRAKTLSAGTLRRSLGLLLVAFVLLMATVLTAMGLANMLVQNDQVAGIASQLAMVPLYPAWACLLAVLYFDLRIRKEGYDIELMARSVGAPPAAADPAPVA